MAERKKGFFGKVGDAISETAAETKETVSAAVEKARPKKVQVFESFTGTPDNLCKWLDGLDDKGWIITVEAVVHDIGYTDGISHVSCLVRLG